MKKWLCLALLLALFCSELPPASPQANPARPPIILYTYYRQLGWGDRVQVGCVDEEGGLWLLIGNDETLKWPYRTEEQLSYLRQNGQLQQIGQLTHDELFDLKSLVFSAPDQGRQSQPAACDAGTEFSYAVQYDREENPAWVLLGMSGDDTFENTDPNAQALYRYLRERFPQVTCYGGGMGPAGFRPVAVGVFCGWGGADLRGAEITAVYMDCEAGPRQLNLTEEERQSVLALALNGTVTGKANAAATTGGTVWYGFSDGEGRQLAAMELYRGLLVRPDGMYEITKGEEQ